MNIMNILIKTVFVLSAIILPMTVSASAQKCKKQWISFPKGKNVLTLTGNTAKCNDFLIRFKKGQRIIAKLTSVKGNAVFYMMQHPLTANDEGAHGFCEDCRDLNTYFDYNQDFYISVFSGSFGNLPEGATNYKLTLTYTMPQTVERGILNKTPINLPIPEISENNDEKSEAKGEVKVKVVVDEDGEIRTAQTISGHRMLEYEAEKACLSMKFKPTVIGKQRVRVSGIIVYNFK